ncbi:MAG: hypothetical protein VB017_08055 [Endomicrobiaceae bacterium]|nr:hypothetical protein [Endomicrobiaceae bacterium]
MKKITAIILILCLFVNVSFAFDPYAGDEIEEKSNAKLYYGIILTLVGGFLVYDGFSKEKVDVSKPMVDYMTVIHGEWTQNELGSGDYQYTIRSGTTSYHTSSYPTVDQNIVYNNGNVDLYEVKVTVRYLYKDGSGISDYRTVKTVVNLKKGESFNWYDTYQYEAAAANVPWGNERNADPDSTEGLYTGEQALNLVDVKIDLSQSYVPIYEKKNKSDIEGVAGICVGLAGIYFIVDYFLDMHNFNQYMKRNDLNIRLAKATDEYKLLFQKRL